MAIVTGDRYLESLVKFVENQADKLIEGTLVLKLNPVGLRYVQSRLEALAELESLLVGAPVDYLRAYVSDLGDHRALEQLRRILRLLPSLKVVSVVPPLRRDPTPLYLRPFTRLKALELRGCDLSTSTANGLLELRFTLEKLICHNSTSLRLLPAVETLDLSRNKFAKVDNLRKCTKLKHVDLGFNNLRSITSFGEVSCQIVKLVLRNNALTSLHGLENLKSLQGVDLSYNVISNFSEIEMVAGLPSLVNLWLEGNPICYARWFRAQVFSLFSHPEQLKLDEKNISVCEFWKRQIIVASRKKQPASFGFYIPLQDADVEESINKRKKRISRLVSIENDNQSLLCSDHDSVSCDNEFHSKDENANTNEAAEIEDLMKKIEFMKDHSVLWLQEFKEWMNQASENSVDGSKWNAVLYSDEEMRLKSEIKDEELGETSRCVFDSFQLSEDESSTIVLESGTSFADASTVASAQRYFDQIGEAASRLFMGIAAGDQSFAKTNNVNQEESRLLSNDGIVSADSGESLFNSLAVPNVDNLTKNAVSPSTSLNDNTESHLASVFPRSPPHYQEDILHRRRNLEEEFLQLSAESLSVASTDSNTSYSEDESTKVGPSTTHIEQSFPDNSSEMNRYGFIVAPYRFNSGDAYHDNILLKKLNGTRTSSICAEGNTVSTDGRELEISALCNDVSSGFNKEKNDWLDKTKRRKPPRRRMISLPEEDDVQGDTDSSKKSSDLVETYQSDVVHEG
ncbi:Outer arm dynein light chain 1 protein [Striga hermonthica]|uniref:Outer arm dynein light chain 1 protein n=1 Tax=Striga hermonthica TaxID=68872 RepID=A0A9N7RGA2_STRHE|nr:Outer arm dynein light chain 1 protein [Striga hermonthica]